ncbi:MAG: alpha-glucan family phosphorylase, partial [Anaerohalosphaeraceae bacterium]
EGITGWAIGENHRRRSEVGGDRVQDAASLYDKLGKVADLYYHNKHHFYRIMSIAVAMNGSFFNTQRMMQQYVLKAYFA